MKRKAKTPPKPDTKTTKPDVDQPQAADTLKPSEGNYVVFKEKEDPRARWYVVHTYSGHEIKVLETLRQRVKSMNLEEKIHEVLVPTQERIKIQRGAKSKVKEKIFPGYILIKAILDEDVWLAIRTTHGITGFVGIGNKPTPIADEEVRTIKKYMEQEAPKYRAIFAIGDAVKIIEGPFADFLGTVESLDEAKGKVRVLVSIFGRETPVELDFLQVTAV